MRPGPSSAVSATTKRRSCLHGEQTVVDRLGEPPVAGIDGPLPFAHVERAELAPARLDRRTRRHRRIDDQSAKARGTTEQATAARVNAAKACKKLKAEQKTAFETAYGTNKNAFGKCVSKTARAS